MTIGPDIVFIAEIETYLPGTTITGTTPGHGTLPHGVLPVAVTAAAGKLYVSDTGYRSAAADAQGVISYPPVMEQGFALDIAINLDPSQSAAGASWGSMSLTNTDRRFDVIAANQNSDGRDVKVWVLDRDYDAARGYWTDRAKDPYGGAYLNCIAGPWTLGLTTLDIPLRDASYWLEKPIQSSLYDGSGGYNGGADLKGKPKPKARGGTAPLPIKNVTPVLVDATNLIYQYNDAAGTVVALYEGGDTNITFQADTANLYAGATTAGKYRTDNSRGLFQLGSAAQRQITADVTGQFPAAGVQTGAGMIAYYLLTEDAALPAGYADSSAFSNIDLTYNDTSGIYIGPDDAIDGITAAASMLTGLNGKLFPKTDGTISAFVMLPPEGSAALGLDAQVPIYPWLTTANVIACEPRPLPPGLYPPPYRYRVGSRRNWTIQTSGFAPTISAARQSTLATKYQVDLPSLSYASAFRRPNDPPIVETMLVHPTAGITTADWLMALWGVRRRLYDVTLPRDLWFRMAPLNVGQCVSLTYPLDDLGAGKLGWIVGLSIRSQDPTFTMQVLV